MTANMTSLIEDAEAAGFTAKVDADGQVAITKKVGRWRKDVGLVVYGCRTAFDVTVAPNVAKGLRSYKDMRIVLGI